MDDLPAVWRATNDVFKQAGVPELTLHQFRAEFCLPFKNFYSRHVPHVTLPQLEQWFHGHFKEVQHLARELPHAREMLQFCHRRRLRTFLLSTIHRDHFAAQSATTGFDPFFDHAYIEVRDKRTKILEILERHSLSTRETLFVGDMQHDIETARHGGILSCAVLTGYNRLDQLRASQPDLIVEHLGELRGLLERNRLELAEQRPESQFKDLPVCGSSGNAEISPDNSTRTSCSENEVGGLGAPASRRRDAGAPRQERGKHLQFPGIFMLCGAAPPYGVFIGCYFFLTAGWQTHSTTWSVIRGPIGAWSFFGVWSLEFGASIHPDSGPAIANCWFGWPGRRFSPRNMRVSARCAVQPCSWAQAVAAAF